MTTGQIGWDEVYDGEGGASYVFDTFRVFNEGGDGWNVTVKKADGESVYVRGGWPTYGDAIDWVQGNFKTFG